MSSWRALAVAVLSVAVANVGFVDGARAGIIGTEVLVAPERAADLAVVQGQLQRAEVRQQLIRMGVAPADVEARVAALSDRELRQLALEIESAPAGGDALAVVGAVFLVLMILEFVGVIDIFKRV